ncbi:MAG: peroxiredoxin [Sphaerochaetaceae bacterium]|jgi:peroxiredoxin Q/BCP|uniref:peroxiredoxin n=1 Tax=Treponema ruminis TaxID=744515 RepID=UPI00197F6E97|nr:peroxiredoxin [Treponema ruminis]MDY6343496.1 peroxiredoxin [Sphaerochaetaceae bacterium]QSI03277.1 peroxiredoxin [Treponema ruminis]
MLQEGSQAPQFRLPDQEGNVHSLDEYRGQKVILYFYPKDMTSGCTKQACGFAERYPQFREKGAVILGVSKDSIASHKKFGEKYHLPFTLLADPEMQAHKAYDVLEVKEGKAKTIRTTYLIDEKGTIVKAMGKVKAAENPGELLALV